MSKDKKNVYIKSLEASDIWNHMNREYIIDSSYCGMIPYSLELMKLQKEGLKIKINNKTQKKTSDDIINIKFNKKVKSADQIIKNDINKKIKTYEFMLKISHCQSNIDQEKVEKLEEKLNSYKSIKERLEELKNLPVWQKEIKVDDLRELLYNNGFYLTVYDKKTKETKRNYYKIYKRSSSKSRTGQVLAIKEDFYDKMISWSRMGLDFKAVATDYPSLLSYESLISSGCEDTIKINPENILIINDIKQTFSKTCNVIKTGKDGYLDSFAEEAGIESNLFDGQSLIKYDYFPSGKSMMLLRQHFFKSAGFACDIQLFLKDYYYEQVDPEGNYDEWQINNMFNQPMLAKNVHMILCPSSLKALKFSGVLGKDVDMWDYWKDIVKTEDNTFGVVKYDKPSKLGKDKYGNILQQTSYQMINSLPANKEDVRELAQYEIDYINRLKNDDDFFINHLKKNKNDTNSYSMWISIYEINMNIVKQEVFRNFRSKQISSYIHYVKGGKIKLVGDYCYLLGNPIEMLYSAVGVDILTKDYKPVLEENEIYTKLFDFGKKYVCFRNPHTSPSNVLIAKNTNNEIIKKYLKLSKNVVMVNAIDFAIQRILSGCDYDSDTMVIFNNNKLLEVARRCYDKYNVCINQVDYDKTNYQINSKSHAEIDNKLSKSQFYIGNVVNDGQFAMSRYWDLVNRGKSETKEAKEYLKIVDVCTVLSEISIDMAKRIYNIDLQKEIENIEMKLTGKKPKLFKYVSKNENIKNKIVKHECPMDFLEEVLKFKNSKGNKNEDLNNLLVKYDFKKRKRKQTLNIINYIHEMNNQLKYVEAIYSKKGDSEDVQNEKFNLLEDIRLKYENLISKSTVNSDTMYALLVLANDKHKEIFTELLKMLEKTQARTFNKAFKKVKRKRPESLAM